MHVAFALHYMAFALLLFVATGIVLEIAWRIDPGFPGEDSPWIAVAVSAALVAWLTPAFRRAYASSTAAAFAQALVITLLFMPALTLFRFIVFFTVFWSV